MKKLVLITSALCFSVFLILCKPEGKKVTIFPPQLIKLLDSLGINCESNEENISPCDSVCLEIKWVKGKTDSLLLITDKNCHGSGDMRTWLCQSNVTGFHVLQSFVAVQSVVEDSLSGTLFQDLHISYGLSPALETQKENVTIRHRFANGIFVPLELESVNNSNYEIPVKWLEQSGKNIDGCSFFVKNKNGADTLRLKYFTKEKISETTNDHKEIWLLKYIDNIHFVANTWVFEKDGDSSKLLAFFSGKIISATKNMNNDYPEFRLSFESISDSLRFPHIYYKWNGQDFKPNVNDEGAYYFGSLESK